MHLNRLENMHALVRPRTRSIRAPLEYIHLVNTHTRTYVRTRIYQMTESKSNGCAY